MMGSSDDFGAFVVFIIGFMTLPILALIFSILNFLIDWTIHFKEYRLFRKFVKTTHYNNIINSCEFKKFLKENK